jgi:hypothetical protein
MKIGTKSVLFGAHQFILHPLLCALAWWRLYGFPWDPRLWLAFVVHDLGYVGKAEMDGPEGELHVEWGARLMGRLFGPKWYDLCVYHSRFRAKQDGRKPSRLCIADKYLIVLEPAWLYLPRVRLSGEVREYMSKAHAGGKYSTMNLATRNQLAWYKSVQAYLRKWVAEHKDGREDTWTPGQGDDECQTP